MVENVTFPDGGVGAGEGSALTARELEIVALVVDGLSNREIGDRLAISARTVQSHLAATMRKLRAKTRTQVAVVALRSGLVAIDGPPPGGAAGSGELSSKAPGDGGDAGDGNGGFGGGGVGTSGDAGPVSRWECRLQVRPLSGGLSGSDGGD